MKPRAFGRSSIFPNAWRNVRCLALFAARKLWAWRDFWGREGAKDVHKGYLWGMYVRPDARNTGVGRKLAEAVIDYAREHVEILQLDVVSENKAARRLYASLGFVEYGIERKALKQHGRYYDEVLMAKDLTADATDLKADAE